MSIETTFIRRCIASLEHAVIESIQIDKSDNVRYFISRAALISAVELEREQSGNSVRERLAAYFTTNSNADRLFSKDLDRHILCVKS